MFEDKRIKGNLASLAQSIIRDYGAALREIDKFKGELREIEHERNVYRDKVGSFTAYMKDSKEAVERDEIAPMPLADVNIDETYLAELESRAIRTKGDFVNAQRRAENLRREYEKIMHIAELEGHRALDGKIENEKYLNGLELKLYESAGKNAVIPPVTEGWHKSWYQVWKRKPKKESLEYKGSAGNQGRVGTIRFPTMTRERRRRWVGTKSAEYTGLEKVVKSLEGIDISKVRPANRKDIADEKEELVDVINEILRTGENYARTSWHSGALNRLDGLAADARPIFDRLAGIMKDGTITLTDINGNAVKIDKLRKRYQTNVDGMRSKFKEAQSK